MPTTQKSPKPPVEVELKFQIGPGGDAILRADAIFGRLARRVHQVTTYHDTPDRLLFMAGLSLRIRLKNGAFVQNVKSRDTRLGPASSRFEWEWPVLGDRPDVGKIAEVPELEALARQIAGRLEPVIVTDVWRTKRLVDLADGAVVEAALDIGHVVSGALTEPICELELELKDGPLAPLYRCALRLAETAPIWISTQSKAARGWSLHNGFGDGAKKLRKIRFDQRLSAGAALHQISGALLGHLTTNIAPTLAGDAEALRQMRGALRQMRALFKLFRPLLDKREVLRFTGLLQQFAQTFGAARDWDVFCLQTLPSVEVELPQYDWSVPSALAHKKRAKAHAAVQRAICGPDFTRLILELALWSEMQAKRSQVKGKGRLRMRLSKIAPDLFGAFAAKARQAGRHPARMSMQELHDFRKALDRVNAASRFLGGFYPAQSVAAYCKRSSAVRDIIGAANDAQVTKSLTKELAMAADPAFTVSIEAMDKWADHRQAHALTDLEKVCRRFRKAEEFWKI